MTASLIGWNPLASATSGAAFGSFLAATLLNATIQNAFRQSDFESGLEPPPTTSRRPGPLPGDGEQPGSLGTRVGSASSRTLSLAIAPLALLVLLAATYLYIILAGIPGAAESAGKKCIDNVEVIAECAPTLDKAAALAVLEHRYGQMTSAAFSISGTLLALGGLMTLMLIALALGETTQRNQRSAGTVPASQAPTAVASEWAAAAALIAVGLIGWILLWGYYVGARSAGQDTGFVWNCSTIAAMVVSGFVGANLRAERTFVTASVNRAERVRNLVAVLLLAGIPTGTSVFIVSRGPSPAMLTPLVASVCSCVLYGLVAGLLVRMLVGVLWVPHLLDDHRWREPRRLSDSASASTRQAAHSQPDFDIRDLQVPDRPEQRG